MSLLPFGSLPPHCPRQFVPSDLDLNEITPIEALFDQLESRLSAVQLPGQLEEWLMAVSELSAVLEEDGSRRYIAMTCHTDNSEAEKAYLHFVENIEPRLKPRQFRLAKLYLEHPLRSQLSRDRYLVHDRDAAVRVELFRDENVVLETEEARLGNEYQKLTGALTVQYRGEEKTLTQMGRLQEQIDRDVREEAWRLVSGRRLQEVANLDRLMDDLVGLRNKIAHNAGFPNYRDFAFRSRGRFDYGPGDCERFHDSIEAEVMPLVRQLQASRRRQLGVGTLRPWDLSADPLNRPPLVPFKESSELESGTQTIFDRLDPVLADQPNLPAAIVFYLIYILGIVLLAVLPNRQASVGRTAVTGAILGVMTYATYDLTNQATLSHWPWSLTVIDMVWGTILSGLSAAAAAAASGWIAKR